MRSTTALRTFPFSRSLCTGLPLPGRVPQPKGKARTLLLAGNLLAGLLLFGGLSACTKSTTTLGLINSRQMLPMPAFYAKDESTSDELPRFAQIRVYELNAQCQVPNCPIMWDVVVSNKHAPNEFVYGGFPGFGAQTVIPAQPLQPGKRYMLVTLPDQFGEQFGLGQFRFRVTDDGRVVASK